MFRNVYAIIVFLSFVSLCCVAYGQDGQIQGKVLDTSGAGIPKAIIHVSDQRTGMERKIETNDSGQYTVAGLAPGLYKIIVEAPGFSVAMSDQIAVNPGQSAVMDFTLKVDAASVDIVVAAEKRDERLLDVPESMTEVQPEPLVETGQVQLRDYYPQIPGFIVSPNVNADQVLSLRGISTAGFSNPTVGVLVDDAPYASRNSVPDIDPEDLERIELLRGPQGTLYGANSMGGLINYITADPSTTKIFGRFEAGTNSVDNGAEPGYDLRASVNLPIRDNLALRMSGFKRQDAGYVDNVQYNLQGVNRTNAYGVRLATLWAPGPQLAIRLAATYQDTQAQGGTEVVTSLGQYKTNLLPDAGAYYYRPQIYNARVNYGFHNLLLTSDTSYSQNDYYAVADFSDGLVPVVSPLFGCNCGVGFYYTQNGMHRTTEELRLASNTFHHSVEWLIGVFSSDQYEPNTWHMDAQDYVTGNIVGDFWNYTSPTVTEEYAAFANAKVRLAERFDIGFGARESRSLTANLATYESGPAVEPPLNFAPVYSPEISGAANKFTYSVSPAYHITPDIMAYARVATGFRPPSPNSAAPVAQGAPALVKSDTITNYELGLKGEFLNHALAVEAAGYRIDWSDIQIQLVTNAGAGAFVYNGNGSSALSQGFELNAQTRPAHGLSLNGWISYDDAKITKDFAYGVSGDKLPFAPQFSAFISGEENLAISHSWTAFAAGDYSYIGDTTGVFQSMLGNAPRQVYPAYSKVDLRLGAKTALWRAQFYSTNLNNSHGQLNGGLGYSTRSDVFIETPPRSTGISVQRRF